MNWDIVMKDLALLVIICIIFVTIIAGLAILYINMRCNRVTKEAEAMIKEVNEIMEEFDGYKNVV